MESEEIRAPVEEFFAARADDANAIFAVSDDVVWAPPAGAGIGEFHGRDAVVAALTGGDAGKVFKIDTLQRDVHQIVVEGDTAVGFMTTTADPSLSVGVGDKQPVTIKCFAGCEASEVLSALDHLGVGLYIRRIRAP